MNIKIRRSKVNVEMKTSSPLVSVIMPAYHAASFLEKAVLSVINQTMDDWELYIIDDCSDDDTFRIAQNMASTDLRIHALQNEMNMGVAKTRNKGIDLAKGQYIAFLDSDDIWMPEKLERQLAKMRTNNAGICYCSYEIIGITGEKVRPDYLVSETASFEDILKENYIQCSAMLIREDIVRKYKFNTDFFHEDYILGLDMLRAGESAVGCQEVLLQWRYLANSRSFDKKKSAMNRWRIYRKYLHLPLWRTVYLFSFYAVAGFRKYFRKNTTQ